MLLWRKLTLALLTTSFLIAGCSKPEQREAAYIKRGNALFDQGAFEKARLEYKNAARIRPTDPEVAYRFGLVDEAEEDFHAAFADYVHAEQQDAHYHPALIKLAEYFLAGEHYDEAQKRIASVLADTPDDADAHAMQAALLLRQKNYTDTEKEARFALTKDPNNVRAFSVLAGFYKAEGKENVALATLNDGITRNPGSLPLLLLKAHIFEQSNQIDPMAETYQAIFKLAPKEMQYRIELANTYLKAGRLDDAEATLRSGVAAAPDDWDMKHELVIFLGDHRSIDAAEKDIRALMAAYPNRPEPPTWLTDLYIAHNDADQALSFLRSVIDAHPDDPQGLNARTALARLEYVKGQKDEAETLATAVLQQDPNNLDARFLKARFEYDKGQYQNAVIDLRGIVRDKPKAKQALLLLGETYLLQGHPDLAIDTLSQAVDADPLDFEIKVRLAQMYHLNGETRRAMDMLFLVTKTAPLYPLGWEAIARIAIDQKDWSTAEQATQKLDALDSEHNVATFLKAEILAGNGKTEDAIAMYKRVIEADPSSSLAKRALVALVGSYQSLHKMGEATSYIESLKAKDPGVTTILGETYLASGNTDQAAANLDLAINSNVTSPEPYLDRARMFMADKKPERALDTLKKETALAPADIRGPLMEAQILGETGHYQEAIALYENILTRNPDLEAVANNLAEIIADYDYSDPHALEKAASVAQRFSNSSNPLFLDTLAWVYYRQGKMDDARTTMERAMAMGGKLPPQVHYHYGAILARSSGRTADARAELISATSKNANYPGLDEARKILSGL